MTLRALSAIHTMTKAVWPTRYRPVPRKRASPSENRPNASASYRELIGTAPRGTDRSALSLRPSRDMMPAMESLYPRPGPPPARRQQVVEHVVDGNRAEQVARLV